jgi:hypothetical protein
MTNGLGAFAALAGEKIDTAIKIKARPTNGRELRFKT